MARAGGREGGSIGGRRSSIRLSSVLPQSDGGFVGKRKYLVSTPPLEMEELMPYDSERMPSRPGLAINKIATQSPGGEGWGEGECKATWRVAPGEEIVEGIIREIFQKGYKSAKSAQ